MPVAQPAAEPPAITLTTHNGPVRSGIAPLQLRALVVDDNRDAADTLGGLLMLAGANVRVCYDSFAAAELFHDFEPDVGLFDVNMAQVDGCELARWARGEVGNRPLLLVAITGVSDAAAVRRTGAAGFNLHLTKPADPRELIATLSDFGLWLRAKRASGEA